jgi:hypothetical protein
MEYIDGEDLASLMKRIGHLSNEKALDIARQLVAGLSVAHERGVLHRDLKPANIMLDGHGRVRITDFGLAIAVGDESQAEEVAGTPAYMAPEQLAGKGATVRSDIYSLGLILYEIYTGKKAFTAKTLAELREQKETQTPRAPSEIRQGIDPVVERVIQRCMEKDPNSRPASVAQLAGALPGGDPLAAAIAAGETPSPEMVAASGSKEGLRPWIAWSCLAFIILCLGATAILASRESILSKVPIEKKPEVMVQTARDILKDCGYTEPPVDSSFQFISATSKYFDYIEKTDQSPDRFDKIPALTIQFWYRQSPKLLKQSGARLGITLNDPAFTNHGESIVWLDSQERLIGLRVIPPEDPVRSVAIQPPDWSMLFEAAGLVEDDFNTAETESIPPVYDDIRAAWTGTLPDFPGTEIRVEAAAWQGRPVFWRMIVPSWDNFSTADLPTSQDKLEAGRMAAGIIIIIILLLVFSAGPVFFAWRNLRMGRGDRRGANRLAGFYLILMGIGWIFGEHHTASLTGELAIFSISVAKCVYLAVFFWLMYIAFEPFARRHWPGLLISWNRLLAGNYRDPLVGRDLLIGCTFASAAIIFGAAITFSPQLFEIPGASPRIEGRGLFSLDLSILSGSNRIVFNILQSIKTSIDVGLVTAFFVFMLRVLLRRIWIVAIVLIVSAPLIFYISTGPIMNSIYSILGILYLGIAFIICFRFGLLAIIAFMLVLQLRNDFLWLLLGSNWYFNIGITGLVLILVFALYAFYTSLGGRPLFGTLRLDD